MHIINKLFYAIILLSYIFPCAVCFGAPDHPVTQGMNSAIIFLLFVIMLVLSLIAASIIVLMRRTKAIQIQKENK